MKDVLDKYRGRLLGGVGALLLLVYMLSPQSSAFGAGMGSGQIVTELLPAAYVGITALSLVLIYRTVRIINFAQVGFAVVGQQLFYEFYTRDLMPYSLSWIAGIIGGTLITMVVGIIASTLFFRHPRLTMTVVTVFLAGIIQFASQEITNAFTKPGEAARLVTIPLADTFENKTLTTIGIVPFRVAHLIGFLMVILVLAGLVVFFKKTRFGIAVRASAENADRASLLGINVKLVHVTVWSIVGLITTVVALAQMPVIPFIPGGSQTIDGLLPALSAAVLARFMGLPSAFMIGMGLHLAGIAMFTDLGDASGLNVILFAAVLVGLLFQRQKFSRVEEASSWKAVREVRPTPAELLALPAIRNTRRVAIIVAAIFVVAIPFLFETTRVQQFGVLWTFAVTISSLTVLTGWTGQISLGHAALAGFGSIMAANATATWGLPFLLALPLGGLAGAAAAFLIGLPALRIRGLFLGIATFAMGIAFPILFLTDQYLASWVPKDIEVVSLFGLGFDDPKVVYFVQFALFVVVALGVKTLRASRAGRLLIALRDNEQGVQSFGVDVVRTRLMAFAISGFIAGIGGALSVHVARGMTVQFSGSQASFLIFQLAIIGGVSTLAGAVLGAALFVVGGIVFPGLFALVTGLGGLALMMAIPGGLSQIFFGMRDAVLRVVALRKQIVVPSLFADYSPEAWEKRLTPLAPSVPSQGIGSLPADQRYALPSRLYGKVTV